jgi:cytochrome c oxidase subunit 4
VLNYFMHLKYEDRVFKVMLLVSIVTLATIIGLTFFDVAFR